MPISLTLCNECGGNGVVPVYEKTPIGRKNIGQQVCPKCHGGSAQHPPPGTDQDLMNDLRADVRRLEKCMERAMKMLEVPAAEYVPAINDAWEELQKGLMGR